MGRRLRKPTLAGLGCAIVIAVITVSPLAAAASKGNRASEIADRIERRGAEISEAQRQAREAGVGEMTALAALQGAVRESRRAAALVREAGESLQRVRNRYQVALRSLEQRLDEIYRSPQEKPEPFALLLGADSLEEVERVAAYLTAVGRADAEVSERVARLRDAAREQHEMLRAARREHAAEVQAITARRAAYIRAEARALAAVDDLGAAQRRDRGRLSRARAARLPGTSYPGGPYSIPTYIVMCESGGNYRALNPSSGAGGAYQILPSTWKAYGGKGLPHLASKAEQDRIAALIWRDAGPGAWVCS